jgi:hypothetical protein
MSNTCPRNCDEPGNCTTPLRGEYKEILSHCQKTSGYTVNGKIIENCSIDRDKFLKLRVCNHPLEEHCIVCKTGCSCKYLTKASESDFNILLTLILFLLFMMRTNNLFLNH